ncbi:hypothetical protein [Arsenophonus apicola]|uniref:hypothetical protein n=1 Tax=Arsenophonus apicola TaxID=2879119 RepID=UPI002873B016|nr:hypothetical protein [Arsenophonus apicola]
MNVKAARGIRNNNPGNIDYNPVNKWQGQLPVDKSIESRFVVLLVLNMVFEL